MYEPLRDKTNPGLHQNTFLKTAHKSRMMIAHLGNLDSRSERMRTPTLGKVDEPVTQSALCARSCRAHFSILTFKDCQVMLVAQPALKKLRTAVRTSGSKNSERMVETLTVNCDFPRSRI